MEKEVEYELVYNNSAAPLIRKEFPKAIMKDASDEMHPDRISVKIPGTTVREFYEHALEEGYALIVLGFQIRLNAGKKEDPEFSKMCEDFMAERDG